MFLRVTRGARAPQNRRYVFQGQKTPAILKASENPLKCPRREKNPKFRESKLLLPEYSPPKGYGRETEG